MCYVARIGNISQAGATPVEVGKYWLIEHLDEQLGKAKFHFLEQIAITILLNRTLVLPNVDNSEIGLRLTKPFEYYYQRDALASLVRTLSTTEFNSYMIHVDIRRLLKAHLVYIGAHSCSIKRLSWNSVQSATFKRGSLRPSRIIPCIEALDKIEFLDLMSSFYSASSKTSKSKFLAHLVELVKS